MKATATISSKNQITIPAEVRKRLGLKPGMKIAFVIDEDGVRIEPQKSILDYFGYFKAPPGMGIDFDREIDEAMSAGANERARDLAKP